MASSNLNVKRTDLISLHRKVVLSAIQSLFVDSKFTFHAQFVFFKEREPGVGIKLLWLCLKKLGWQSRTLKFKTVCL